MLKLRKPLLPEWRYWPAIALCVLLLLPVLSLAAPSMQAPAPQASAHQREEVGNIVNASPESVADVAAKTVAYYTKVLAWFTAVLAGVGLLEGGLIGWQVWMARREFNATHRPKIILRDVSYIVEGGENVILYSLVNCGDADGTIIESWILAEWPTPGRAVRNLTSNGHNDLGTLHLAPGEDLQLRYVVPADLGVYFAAIGITTEVAALHFAGAVRYEDSAGCRRRSVFRRWCDPKTEGFYRTENLDYEYAD